MTPLIEVCVEGIDGLIVAQQSGADRVELCASLLEGGLTPSVGTVTAALQLATVPFYPIVRPRGGDFLYSDAEFASMQADIAAFRQLGVKGVVFGILTPEARIDEARMRALVEAADGMDVTCHRAFDMTRDIDEAVEALIRAGVKRVLTSGQRDTAIEGLATLKRTVEKAAGRIKIMACGALAPDTIARVRDETGAPELHFATLTTIASGMTWSNPNVGMGGTARSREYELTVTDGELAAATIAAARG
ncbi:MAG: copper homeostasis protein CutC [Ancalomicrobiaceae bacterium]|nr:copper homeostasis protein CutC [Ancalomicrobiaceae bacterium]